MSKFRKKPVVIDAARWTGDWAGLMEELGIPYRPATPKPEWVKAGQTAVIAKGGGPEAPTAPNGTLAIKTLEGVMVANLGDWVIRGLAGEYYPCKDEIFAASYQPVDESQPTG